MRAPSASISCLTAHKMYGPKGVGALYFHPNVGTLEPLLHGCGQERGRRSGTLNVPTIVGFGAAAAIATAEVEDEGARVGALRDGLLTGLLETIPDLRVNGSLTARLPHNLHVSVYGVDGQRLGPLLDDLAVLDGIGRGVSTRGTVARPRRARRTGRPRTCIHPIRPGPMDDGGDDRSCNRAHRDDRRRTTERGGRRPSVTSRE